MAVAAPPAARNGMPPPFWAGPGKVSVKLGTEEVEWTCLTRTARLEPSVEDPTSVDTFCGPITLQSGQTTWVLTLNTNEAFGPGGTEDILRPIAAAGAPIPFKLEADGYSASGTVLPQQFPWGGDANSTWEYDMSWPVQGQPIFTGPDDGGTRQLSPLATPASTMPATAPPAPTTRRGATTGS